MRRAATASKRLHIGAARRIGGHEADRDAVALPADRPSIKSKSVALEPLHEFLGQGREYFVRLDRLQQSHARHALQALCERGGHRVGMARIGEPQVVVKVGEQLGAQKAQLRPQVPALFTAPLEILGERRIEEHDRLGAERTVLGGAERQHVDAGFPGRRRGRYAEMAERIRETRAVHVDRQAMFTRHRRDLVQLRQCINRTPLGRLREAHRGGLDMMDAQVVCMGDRRGQLCAGNLAVASPASPAVSPRREELGRPALVGDDVRALVAINAAVGRHQLRECECIGGRAGGHRKNRHRRFEHLACDSPAGAPCKDRRRRKAAIPRWPRRRPP